MEKEFLEECLAEGMSLEAIGKQVGKHESTVSYWLKKHGLEAAGSETHAPNAKVDPQRLAELVEQGASIQAMGDEFGAGRSTIRYWLRKLGLAGGRCALCGFDGHPAALQFHHLDPSGKSFHLSEGGLSRGIAQSRAEAEKCVLLCANCHAQVEVGVKSVSAADR